MGGDSKEVGLHMDNCQDIDFEKPDFLVLDSSFLLDCPCIKQKQRNK